MKALELGKVSSDKGRWVPPPGKSSRAAMAWEGPTHRLEILTAAQNEGDTVLKMSDLDDGESAEVIVRDDPVEEKIGSLLSEVDALKAEVDLQNSLRKLESKESELQRSKASLREKEAQLENCRDELLRVEQENNKLKNSIDAQNKVTMVTSDSQRDKLLQKLVEVEMDSHAAVRQCEALKAALSKLERSQASTVYMKAVNENRELLMGRLEEIQASNRSLRKLLREEGSYQTNIKGLAGQRELLLQRLAEAEATIQDMRSQLDDKEALVVHSQTLHNEIGQKNAEIESMVIRIQTLEDQLKHRDHEWVELEAKLLETQTKYSREKEALKRSSREQKTQASRNEEMMEAMTKETQDLKMQLEEAKNKLSKASRDNIRYDAEMSMLKGKIKELEESRSEIKRSNDNSVHALSSQLTEKTYEINALQLQNDRLKAKIASLEGALSGAENASISKVSALETEIAHLQTSVSTCEGLLTEYRAKLEKSHRENEELSKELRKTEQQLERSRQECSLETERCHMKLQQQLSELEAMPELLKTTEVRLKDSHGRLAALEQQIANQTQLIGELTAKSEQHSKTADEMREKWHGSMADNRVLSTRIENAEKRAQEAESQNKDLVAIAMKKEEMIQKLQHRIDEQCEQLTSIRFQMESTKEEAKQLCEQQKEKAVTKDRSYHARIAELESQLNRANSLATQLKKSKDESDRHYQARLQEVQERLDQANTTKKSLENYVNFLKSSYTSVFNDLGNSASPLLH